MNYNDFLKSKAVSFQSKGISQSNINPVLFDFQKDIVKWALKIGRSAIWADCGLGKSFMQIEWAKNVKCPTIIAAPLSVSHQTILEGEKLGVKIQYVRDQKDVGSEIVITNYEMLSKFDPKKFNAVVLDESSILKNYTGAIRNEIIEMFAKTEFKLACTATPAPNDHMEIGNHAEFLGAMSRTEMLSMFFVHDGGETSKWRIKGHAEKDFWRWVCSWAVMLRKPSDLGYKDNNFILPELKINQINVESKNNGEFLFPMEARTLSERISSRRDSINERTTRCAAVVNDSNEAFIIWCNLNSEADQLEKLIKDSKQVKGSQSSEQKISILEDFTFGKLRVLISKPSICGFGLNWQHCKNVIFVGLSDSWEQYYQAVRRCWRFGQKNQVEVVLITAESEGAVVSNIKRKEHDALLMAKEMINNMSDLNKNNLKITERKMDKFTNKTINGETFKCILGDCVEEVEKIEDESIGMSLFSPPFASLYTYSASDRDMGNSKNYKEFKDHFKFLIKQLFKKIKSGRMVSFHCMNLPTSKTHHGYIGIRDFRGELIRMFEEEGFIFHSEVCIWKDPVIAMQRTKAIGLLHKQMVKDSCVSRQGIPDYLVTMRKPGENKFPVSGELDKWIGDESFKSNGRLSIDLWQRYASPVWMDINPSRTLQASSAREEKDERHICPLQLDVVERALTLWSNEGDLILSPFMGIGSEGYVAIDMNRKFIGIELKESYFNQAVLNLRSAQQKKKEQLLIA